MTQEYKPTPKIEAPKFDLNEKQLMVKTKTLEFIAEPSSNGSKYLTITGPAGSGKTTTIQQIIKEIPGHQRIGITGPTHKCVKVIRKMAAQAQIDGKVDIRTIHSALGLTMKQVEGDEQLVKEPFAEEQFYDVLFIDECSMLGDDILQFILECMSKKIIFVGDKYQISPVGTEDGEISRVFTEVDIVLELTEVVRHDNPIINLATRFREQQDEIYPNFPEAVTDLDGDGHGVIVEPAYDWFQNILKYVKSPEFREDPDHCRVVCYRNATVNMINQRIRQELHGMDVPEYLVGEVIVAQGQGKDYKNAEEFRIMEINDSYDQQYEVDCWEIKMDSFDTNEIHTVMVVKTSYLETFNDRLSNIAKRARMDKQMSRMHWRDFWGMKKKFGEFKHVFALTAHKSQGSTFDRTFIYTSDFCQFGASPDILQLLYTGTTRSRFNTHLALG